MSLKEIVLDLIQASVPDMHQTCALQMHDCTCNTHLFYEIFVTLNESIIREIGDILYTIRETLLTSKRNAGSIFIGIYRKNTFAKTRHNRINISYDTYLEITLIEEDEES